MIDMGMKDFDFLANNVLTGEKNVIPWLHALRNTKHGNVKISIHLDKDMIAQFSP